jgi:hypothetical protein
VNDGAAPPPEDAPDDDDDETPRMHEDLAQLAADELRRRTEAPLPRSLTDFLR